MAACGVCKNNSMFPEQYGNLTLCKKCSMKILTPKWKNKKYSTNDEVREQCEKTLSQAIDAGFPAEAVQTLKAYFDGLIVPGLFKILDGGNYQKIVVKEDSIVIATKENYDPGDARKQYGLVMSGRRGMSIEEDNEHDPIDATAFARAAIGALSSGGSIGKMAMRAGAGIASELLAKSDNSSKEDLPVLPQFDVPYGKQAVKYEDVIDFQFFIPEGEETYGFLIFTVAPSPRKQKKIVFSFTRWDDRKKSVKEIAQFIEEKLDNLAVAKEQESVVCQAAPLPGQNNTLSAPDELMKWKQLLDAGAITEEEYSAKKKQLLGL